MGEEKGREDVKGREGAGGEGMGTDSQTASLLFDMCCR